MAKRMLVLRKPKYFSMGGPQKGISIDLPSDEEFNSAQATPENKTIITAPRGSIKNLISRIR
jgi:hypothetical protein